MQSMSFQAYMIHFVTWGGGDPKKDLDILGGYPKKQRKFSNCHPSRLPLVNNERSLKPGVHFRNKNKHKKHKILKQRKI